MRMKKMISLPFSKNDSDVVTPEIVSVSNNEAIVSTYDQPTADELGRLRDILFGSQTRTIEKRLSDLETGLQTLRREIHDTFNEKIEALSIFTSAQLSETRNELNRKIEALDSEQSLQLKTRQKELLERIENQSIEQTTQLRAVQKELAEGVDKLAVDFMQQLRGTKKELSDHTEKLGAEQTERIRNLQIETRQRDDNLRQELLAIADSLENKKTSRQDLGQMLVELGIRLRRESDSSSS
jgi:hypothetical protein